jgi:hypothetical protein
MHAKRTLFNYGKIFVITRPLPSTIPIPTLFSHPSCLTLQPTTPLMIPSFPMSSKRVPRWRGTQTRVSPLLLFLPSRIPSATIDKARRTPGPCAHRGPCSSFRRSAFIRETRSWPSQGQQEQEEHCGHSRIRVRSSPSGRREEEKGETS